MTAPVVYGLCGAALVAIGLWGLIAHEHLLRRILGFNLVGSGMFLFFGALAARGGPGAPDPVPLAMVITGIVVALAATALALALAARLESQAAAEPAGADPARDGRDDGGRAR